jgi:hypothetical protein
VSDLEVRTSVSRTPAAGSAFTGRASRFAWLTTPGQSRTAQSTAAGAAMILCVRKLFVQEGDDREGYERRREVDEDERTAEAAFDPAPGHVVELARRDPSVGDHDLGRNQREERPDHDQFHWHPGGMLLR